MRARCLKCGSFLGNFRPGIFLVCPDCGHKFRIPKVQVPEPSTTKRGEVEEAEIDEDRKRRSRVAARLLIERGQKHEPRRMSSGWIFFLLLTSIGCPISVAIGYFVDNMLIVGSWGVVGAAIFFWGGLWAMKVNLEEGWSGLHFVLPFSGTFHLYSKLWCPYLLMLYGSLLVLATFGLGYMGHHVDMQLRSSTPRPINNPTPSR